MKQTGKLYCAPYESYGHGHTSFVKNRVSRMITYRKVIRALGISYRNE